MTGQLMYCQRAHWHQYPRPETRSDHDAWVYIIAEEPETLQDWLDFHEQVMRIDERGPRGNRRLERQWQPVPV